MRDRTTPYPHWRVPFENPQYWTLYHLKMTAAQWQPPGSNIIQHPRLRSAAAGSQLYQVCQLCQPVPVQVPVQVPPLPVSPIFFYCKVYSLTQPTFSCGRIQPKNIQRVRKSMAFQAVTEERRYFSFTKLYFCSKQMMFPFSCQE